MSGVPDQDGHLPDHTNARTRELIRLVTRIHEIEGRLEEIEDDNRRHWFQLTIRLMGDKQHGEPAKPKIYICPCCHEFVEMLPDAPARNRYRYRTGTKPRKKAPKGESPPSVPEPPEVLK